MKAAVVWLAVVGAFSLRAQPPSVDRSVEAVDSAAGVDAFDLLRELTGGFGHRLTGSTGERAAGEWALEKMRRLGLTNVHGETWTLPVGWKRLHAAARLLTPERRELSIALYGWSGGTKGAVDGEVTLADGNAAVEGLDSSGWAGRVVLVAPAAKDLLKGTLDVPRLAKLAQAAHALALVYGVERPGRRLVHTGPVGFPGQTIDFPVLDMAQADRELLARLVQEGRRPRVQLDVAAEFTAGPAETQNVVGEIAGVKYPEQVIVLGAHLDSWDVSVGATDDGVGVAAVLGAASLLRAAGVRPERTIRFVLFTGEEQGLLGSRAYVKRHQAEMTNVRCALVLDWGAGRITKFPLAGHAELKATFDGLLGRVEGLGQLATGPGFLTFTDAFAFTLAGVAGIAPLQDSAGYSEEAHSAADTLDKVDAGALRFNTRVVADAAIWLANAPAPVGRVFSKAETRDSLGPVGPVVEALQLQDF